MKAHKQATPKIPDEFPLLPSDKQKAIMEFFLYETSGKIYLDTLQNMSDAEERFFYALMDLVDAYGPDPDERYRPILWATPISS